MWQCVLVGSSNFREKKSRKLVNQGQIWFCNIGNINSHTQQAYRARFARIYQATMSTETPQQQPAAEQQQEVVEVAGPSTPGKRTKVSEPPMFVWANMPKDAFWLTFRLPMKRKMFSSMHSHPTDQQCSPIAQWCWVDRPKPLMYTVEASSPLQMLWRRWWCST